MSKGHHNSASVFVTSSPHLRCKSRSFFYSFANQRSTLGKLAIGIFSLTIGLVIFGVIQSIPASFTQSDCVLDQFVPFMPEAIIIYISFFITLPIVTAVLPEPHFQATLKAYLLASLVAFLIFIVYPTQHSQQPLDMIDKKWIAAIFQCIYSIDRASNCLPSLHVTLSVIAALGISNGCPQWKIHGGFFASCIIMSTILTKQHHIIDLLAGIVLAVLVWQLSKPTLGVAQPCSLLLFGNPSNQTLRGCQYRQNES